MVKKPKKRHKKLIKRQVRTKTKIIIIILNINIIIALITKKAKLNQRLKEV